MEKNFAFAAGDSPQRGVFGTMARTDFLGNWLGRISLMDLRCRVYFVRAFSSDPPYFAPFSIRAAGIRWGTGFFVHFIDFSPIYRYNNVL